MDNQKETERVSPGGLALDLIQFFDEWQQILPVDAREALRPLVNGARNSLDNITRIEDQAALMFCTQSQLAMAGVIGDDVPAERVADAVLRRIALIVTGGGANSREFGGIRRPAAPIPKTPEEAIAFIGDQCEVREDAKDLDRVRFQLTVHDLLSAFRWWFDDAESESVTVTKRGWRWVPEEPTDAMREAAGRGVTGNWRPNDCAKGALLYRAMLAAAPVSPDAADAKPTLYTCIGKGGTYEYLGGALGAGTSRDHRVVLYRDVRNGERYFRTPEDFFNRMNPIKGQR
jgi:hypothetical protein